MSSLNPLENWQSEALDRAGWLISSLHPLALRHEQTDSLATGLAAVAVIESLKRVQDADPASRLAESARMARAAIERAESAPSDLDDPWSVAYDEIFSDQISARAYQALSDLGARLDYYDPDSSYEDDARAFADALLDKARELSEGFR